jgi:hypothetical protein
MFSKLTFSETEKELKGVFRLFIWLAMFCALYPYFFILKDFGDTIETIALLISMLFIPGFFARLMVNFLIKIFNLIIIHSKILLGKVLKWFVRDLFSGIVGRSFDYIAVKIKAI